MDNLLVLIVFISCLMYFFRNKIIDGFSNPQSVDHFEVLGWGFNKDKTVIEKGSQYFIQCCKKFSLPYRFLGIGWDYPPKDPKFEKERHRLFALNEYLQQQTNDNKIILVMDTFDTLISGSTREIIDKFRKFKTRILFSGEKGWNWQWEHTKHYFTENKNKKGPYQFLAAGTYIGYVKDLRKACAEWLDVVVNKKNPKYQAEHTGAEMGIMGSWLGPRLSNPSQVQIDTKGELFWVTTYEEDKEWTEWTSRLSDWKNPTTGTKPLVYHVLRKVSLRQGFEKIIKS